MKISTIFLICLAVAVVAAFVWGYFTSQLPAPLPAWHRQPAGNTPSPTEAGTQSPKIQANRPFTYGNISYLIGQVNRTGELKNGNTTLATSGSFVVVFLSVTNQGMEPVVLQSSDFALYDSQGQKFTMNEEGTKLATTIYQKVDLFGEAVQPGLSREGLLVFEVPKPASGFFLRLSNGYLDANLGF